MIVISPWGYCFSRVGIMVPYLFDPIWPFTMSTSVQLGSKGMLQQTRFLDIILFYFPPFSYSFVLRIGPCFSHRSLHLLSTKVSLCTEVFCFNIYGILWFTLYRYTNALTPSLGSMCFPHLVISNGMCHRTSKIFNSGSWPLIFCRVHSSWKWFLHWLMGVVFNFISIISIMGGTSIICPV